MGTYNRIHTTSRSSQAASWAFVATILAAGLAQADPIGTATEAQNDVSGELGNIVREISLGSTVSANEAVRTGANSAALLEFLDLSKLNVGASSIVVLDRFVYDPDSGADEVVLKVTKGALRFISSGSGKKNVIITTPSALMGIRGTDLVLVCGDELCAAGMLEGQVEICPILDSASLDTATFPEECPCDLHEITAEQEQTAEEEGNFILYGPSCETTGAINVEVSLLTELAELVGQGGELPSPEEIASTGNPPTPTTPDVQPSPSSAQ